MDDLELAFELYADESTGQISLPNAVRRCHSFLFSQNNHYVFKKKKKNKFIIHCKDGHIALRAVYRAAAREVMRSFALSQVDAMPAVASTF